MSIPDYETLMLPLLERSANREVCRFSDVVDQLADEFGLTEVERSELLPSGSQPVFRNRVGWAKSYLKQAGLLTFPKRGYFQITDRGKAVLDENPAKINGSVLEQFPEFLDFKVRRKSTETKSANRPDQSAKSPEDQMATAFGRYQEELESELLGTVRQVTPAYFEQIVVDLLVAMGYGGSRQDARRAVTKQSGDEGIDGVIKQDRLGLDIVYVQAKRWEARIGRPEIQKFVGALEGRRANKGVFISTSDFSKEAIDYASTVGTKVILIDGTRLAELMIEFEVGVSQKGMYAIKHIDSDYFEE